MGIIIWLVIGGIVGWLASLIVRGGGMGILGDLLVGLVGALIGSWLLPKLNISLGSGLLAEILYATIGAVILLLILRLVGGRSGWRMRR